MLTICSVDQRWTGAPPSLPSLPRVGREEVPLVSNFRQVGGFLCKFKAAASAPADCRRRASNVEPPEKGLRDKKNSCCFRLFAKVSCGGTLLPLYSRSSKMRACVARKRDGISGIRVGFAWDSKGIRASFWGFAYSWPYKSLGIRRND